MISGEPPRDSLKTCPGHSKTPSSPAVSRLSRLMWWGRGADSTDTLFLAQGGRAGQEATAQASPGLSDGTGQTGRSAHQPEGLQLGRRVVGGREEEASRRKGVQ